jgi:translation elongation factor EF-4
VNGYCACTGGALQIERKRGITVKAQTASMLHQPADNGLPWLINLIDTPGKAA